MREYRIEYRYIGQNIIYFDLTSNSAEKDSCCHSIDQERIQTKEKVGSLEVQKTFCAPHHTHALCLRRAERSEIKNR